MDTKIILVLGLLLLAACGGTTKPIEVQYTNVYPNLPQIDYPDPRLKTFKYDYPRDQNGKPIKSNIFMGLDFKNWQILQENILILEAAIAEYKARLQEINRQRAEWSQKNSINK